MLDDRIMTTGAVAVMCSDDVPIRAVVSQGCRPIGKPLTITRAERNLVHELAGQPAMDRLQEIVQAATDEDRQLMREGLHVGLVVDEHRLDFERGDFLVRNLLGVDQSTGSLAISEQVEVGQTVQFQVRDARRRRRRPARACSSGCRGAGALLFTCNGRGTHLFPEPDHDAVGRRGAARPGAARRARSARARSARSAAGTSCTASRPASPCSAERARAMRPGPGRRGR